MMDINEFLSHFGVVELCDVEYHLLAGERLQHIHNTQFPRNSFNNSGGGSRRFDPIKHHDKHIGTYYAATHYIDAIAETILRRTSPKSRELSSTHDKELHLSDLKRDLVFLDLEALINDELQEAILLDRAAFTTSGKQPYEVLTGFARAFLLTDNAHHFAGLTWYGYQRGIKGQRCFVLFDDRTSPDDLDFVQAFAFHTDAGYCKLQDAFSSLDHCPPIPFKSDLRKGYEAYQKKERSRIVELIVPDKKA